MNSYFTNILSRSEGVNSILLPVRLPFVGWVEPRNPTTPALKERSMNTIGHLFTVPILKILNIQSIFVGEASLKENRIIYRSNRYW
jgi:hypothetical protein